MSKIKDMLDSPEMEEFRKAWKEQQERYKIEATEFWNNLSYDDSLKVFYYIVSKIYQGDVVERGSYRYVLYDIFRFDMDAYTIGMDAGYMTIHNLLSEGIDFGEMKNASQIIVNGHAIEIGDKEKIEFKYDEDAKTLTINVVDIFKDM